VLIYVITNRVTGKRYVGQTRRTLTQRFNAHKKVVGKSNACKALSDAMQRYGVDNFTIEALCRCESQEELDRREVEFIAKLGTFAPSGYNLTKGGGGKSGYKHRPESVERTAAAHRGKPLSEEHKRKVSASLKGNKRALGLKHTEETKRAISESQRGMKRRPFTDEHRAKLAEARRGKQASKEARASMAEGQRRRYTESLPLLLDGKPMNLQQLADLAGCTRGAMQQRIRTLKLTPEQAVAKGRTKSKREALLLAHYGKVKLS
jgi:group I intron endonuclease